MNFELAAPCRLKHDHAATKLLGSIACVMTKVWPLCVFRGSLRGRSRLLCCAMEQLLFWSRRRSERP